VCAARSRHPARRCRSAAAHELDFSYLGAYPGSWTDLTCSNITTEDVCELTRNECEPDGSSSGDALEMAHPSCNWDPHAGKCKGVDYALLIS
jgi:hypothetical protein